MSMIGKSFGGGNVISSTGVMRCGG
jgi:hypothetical protein